MRNRLSSMVFIFVVATFLFACSEVSSKQKAAADEALKALRKIEVAIQVGVNYMKYGSLVIDA